MLTVGYARAYGTRSPTAVFYRALRRLSFSIHGHAAKAEIGVDAIRVVSMLRGPLPVLCWQRKLPALDLQ